MSRLVVLVALLALLVGASPAVAAEPRFTMDAIEKELMCPTCGTRLDLSQAPAAQRIRAFVEERRQAGQSMDEVKDALVVEYGEAILAAPPKEGLGALAWLLPVGAAALALVAVGGVAVAARRRGRERAKPVAALDDGLEARVDRALADYDA